jgi:hypothetical protein
MDHLPPPLDGYVPRVDVFANRLEYHPGDFFSLFRESDLNFDVLLAKGYSKDNKAEFLQEWLFFSLMAQFLHKTIFLSQFRTEDGMLHTEGLSGLLQEWRKSQEKQLSAGSTVAQRMANTQIRRALADARRYIERHCSMESMLPTECNNSTLQLNGHEKATKTDLLYLSFAILGETLEQAVADLKVPIGCKPDLWKDLTHNDKSWGYSTHNHKTLLSTNKCPAEVRRLESTFNGVLATYCASTMKPPLDPADNDGHDECSQLECNQSREPKKWHFAAFCQENDKQISISPTKLEEITKRGYIPLLTWAQGSLHVHDYDPNDDTFVFGALSHRWKDNILVSESQSNTSFKKEALTCQLKALQHSFNQGTKKRNNGNPNLPFWVDSLCTTKKPLKELSFSISETRHIYKKATMVLVWDRGLLQTHKDESQGVIAHNMRIRASPWARRMWTLLESIVSQDLAIEFKNGRYDLSELRSARDNARANPEDPYHFVWKLGEPYSPAIADLRSPSVDTSQQKYHHIACLWRAVQFRLVSALSDETIILANVLGLRVETLLDIDGDFACEKRMVRFLELLDETPGLGIPPGIIFLPGPALRYGTKNKTKGYGWAPKSWLSGRPQTEANPLVENVFDSFIGKQGLFVTYPGVLLHCSGKPNGTQEFWVPVDQHLLQWYNVVTESPDVLRRIETGVEEMQLGIILSTREVGQKYKIGALVRSKGLLSRGNARWVAIICRVWVRLETDRDTIGEHVKKMRSDDGSMFLGEKLPDEQLWCVDRGDRDI